MFECPAVSSSCTYSSSAFGYGVRDLLWNFDLVVGTRIDPFESRSRGRPSRILRRGYFLLELQPQNRAVMTLFTMEAHPAIITKRWLDCFVREASYAVEVL
jgi:hypothetical protein